MQNRNKLTVFKILTLTLLFAACQPAGNRLQSPGVKATATDMVYEEELQPTWEEPVENSRGIIYERPHSRIKNAGTEVIVGQVKMANVFMTYSTADHSLKVSGVARIIDATKTLLAESDFVLAGSHAAEVGSVDLRPSTEVKSNSEEKPIIRAKATCLEMTAQDQYDCSHVVIDFFIAYKKQIYTQQMEVNRKPKLDKKDIPDAGGPAPVVVSDEDKDDDDVAEIQTVTDKNENSKDAEAKDESKEGNEKSLPGPYRGVVGSADLAKIFEDDEANVIEKPKVNLVVKPEAKPEAKPAAPAKPVAPVTGPAAPKPSVKPEEVKPEIKLEVKPTLPAEPPKSSVPDAGDTSIVLNKDFKQIRGEVRQYNQSIGHVDNGRLRNATSVLVRQQSLAVTKQAFFEIKTPENKNFFATFEMAKLIELMGERLNKTFTRKLYVGSISFQNGGKISPHLSHQIGIDADMGYPTALDDIKFPVVAVNENANGKRVTKLYQNRYSRERTYDLLKFAFNQPDIKIERIFIDRAIKADLCKYAIEKNEFKGADKDLVQKLFESMDHVSGHGNHFHLRLRCSNEDPACRTKLYVKNNGCGIVK